MEELKMNLIDRDIHHISWKNHGIDNYIKKALANYLKNNVVILRINSKKKSEASDADDSFDYDQGYNIEEVYD